MSLNGLGRTVIRLLTGRSSFMRLANPPRLHMGAWAECLLSSAITMWAILLVRAYHRYQEKLHNGGGIGVIVLTYHILWLHLPPIYTPFVLLSFGQARMAFFVVSDR